MHRSIRAFAILLAVLGLSLVSARAEPRAGFHLESRVPASSMAFLALDDLGAFHERFGRTGVGQMMADEEMQAFLAPLEKAIGDFAHERMTEIPPMVLELLGQLHTVKGQIALALVDLDPEREIVQAALSIDFGDQPDEFVAFLERARAQMDPDGEMIETSTREGRAWWTADLGPVTLSATTHDTTFVLATDEALLASVLAGGEGTLGTSAAFQSVRERCGGDNLGLLFYGNVAPAYDRFGELMGERERRMADAFGLDTIQAVAYGLSFQGLSFRDTLLIHAPQADHGLLPLLRMQPMVTPMSLDMVPARAFYWAETHLALDQMIGRVRDLATRVDPDAGTQIDGALDQMAQALGVKVEEELLAGLTGRYGAYLCFPPTGGLFPELALVFELKDPATFSGVFERFAKGLSGVLNEEGDLLTNTRALTYHGVPMHLFEMQAARGDDVVPFTPTWAVLGNRLVLTPVPHTMKEIILRSQGRTSAPGLASKPDFQALMAAKPSGTGGMAYVDTQSALTLLYDTAVPLMQTALKPNVLEEVPFKLDWALLPPASRVAAYFSSMAEYVTCNDEGLVLSIQAPVPIVPLVAVAVGAATWFVVRGSGMPRLSPGDLPVLEVGRAPAQDSLEREMDLELARLQAEIYADAIELFVMDENRLPTSLDELVENGYAASSSRDPWGGAYRIEARAEGGFAIVSAGPDGRVGTEDDLRLERD